MKSMKEMMGDEVYAEYCKRNDIKPNKPNKPTSLLPTKIKLIYFGIVILCIFIIPIIFWSIP